MKTSPISTREFLSLNLNQIKHKKSIIRSRTSIIPSLSNNSKPQSIKKKKQNLNYQYSNFSLSDLIFKNKNEIARFKRHFTLTENLPEISSNLKKLHSLHDNIEDKIYTKRKSLAQDTQNLNNALNNSKDILGNNQHDKQNKIFLTSSEKAKFVEIFRKGIDQKKISKLAKDTSKKDPVKILNTRKTVNNFLNHDEEEKSPSKMLEIDYKYLSEFGKNDKKHNIDALNVEISNKVSEKFQLADTQKFSKEFRIRHDQIDIERDEEMQNILKDLLGKNKLSQDMNQKIEEIRKDEKQERKKELLIKWRRIIIAAAIHFKRLNLSLEEFHRGKFQALKPYEKVGSYELILSVKNGDIKNAISIMNQNKFLVHDFDHFNQTALHWAAKRNRYQLITTIVKHGADINSQDIAGRTALHIAALNNFIETIKILLYELADPFIKNKEGKMPIDLTSNLKCKFFLSKARILHVINKFGSLRKSEERIRFGFDFFFNEFEKKKLDF